MDISTTSFQRLGIALLMAALLWAAPHNAEAQGGSLDPSFQPVAGASYPGQQSSVNSVLLQPDGKILIGGKFALVNNVAGGGVARLNPDGSLDASFNPGSGADGPINAMVLQPDGKIIIAGDFAFFNGAARNRIAKLNADGSLDSTFTSAGPLSAINALALQADGKIVLGGAFYVIGDHTLPHVARLNADGSIDPGFTPGKGTEGNVNAALIQPDGRILVAGVFTSYDNIDRDNIVRLNANGALDTSFGLAQRGFFDGIHALALQGDGKVIAVGSAFSINGGGQHDVVRLETNGILDPSFNFQIEGRNIQSGNPGVFSVFVQTDGKVLVGGNFTSINGISRNNVARLNADGTMDASFDPGIGPDSSVYGLVAQSDGKTVIGGAFTSDNGLPRNNIARLAAIPNTTLQFSAADYSVAENAGSVALTVTRSGDTTDALSLIFATTDGTAFWGHEYIGARGTVLNFPAGSASQQILIPILDNFIAGGNKTFTVTLSGVTGSAALGTPATAIVTIVDDDVPPRITSVATASGMVGQPFRYQITASNNPTRFGAAINGLDLGGLAIDSNTGVISGMPTAAGTFSLALTAENAFGKGSAVLALTILPSPLPTATIAAQTPHVEEGGAKGLFIVSLDSAAATDRTIHYRIGGSAMPGLQYKALKGSVVVPAGSRDASIKLKSYHDGARVGTRMVNIILRPGDSYLLGNPAKAKISIIDAD